MSCAPSTKATKSYDELADHNLKLRSLLEKAAKYIDTMGDPVSAAMLLEASK